MSAIAGSASATVSWNDPSSNGSPITGYKVMWSGGSKPCNGSPCQVSGLTSGTTYIFTVAATNAVGTGPASAPSNGVTPMPPASPPPGGPVPAQLLGDWFLPPSANAAINGYAYPCPSPAIASNCFIQLTFTATTFEFDVTSGPYQPAKTGQGNVVVNNDEIDFFNGVTCALPLPDGVGRYKWKITRGVLTFTLISDPCERPNVLTYHGYSPYPTVPGWTRKP